MTLMPTNCWKTARPMPTQTIGMSLPETKRSFSFWRASKLMVLRMSEIFWSSSAAPVMPTTSERTLRAFSSWPRPTR